MALFQARLSIKITMCKRKFQECFYYLICIVLVCFAISCNGTEKFEAPRRYNNYNAAPAYNTYGQPYSRYYNNPYAAPSPQYPYYDSDQYYVPPKGYSPYDQDNKAAARSTYDVK